VALDTITYIPSKRYTESTVIPNEPFGFRIDRNLSRLIPFPGRKSLLSQVLEVVLFDLWR
jgi:hypothetical protein